MSWAGVHRWLAIVLVVPLVTWSITGLLFHLKPGWDRAYDMPRVERPGVVATAGLAPLTSIEVNVQKVELFDSALGPLYRVTTANGTELFDARTAKRRSPLSAEDANLLVRDAVERSPHRAEYGALLDSASTDGELTARFERATVTVDRKTARLSQRGDDTDRIDWLYRIHYLQWTNNPAIDRVIAIGGLIWIWAVLLPGLVLFLRRLRRTA
ncbi:MAG: PepSY domain-containing protein [Kofleriaceae bacterium]